MELAVHYTAVRGSNLRPLPRGCKRDTVLDLAILDTATGHRRVLAGNVAWYTPRWSADGRRVRFEQRLEDGGFALREIDVETGAISDAGPEPPVPPIPGDYDTGSATFSPAGRWLAFRRNTGALFAARADGSAVFALPLPFDHFADTPHWSPCGTKLATRLTAGKNTGAYVLHLLTGDLVRVSAADPEANWFVSGWSPDGTRIVAMENRWHNPKRYDYELNDVWLLAADGSGGAEQLTADGRHARGAIRPSGEAVANGESELTFAWAKCVYSAADRPAGEALAAQFRIDVAAGPPFDVLLMVRTPSGIVYPHIPGCQNIPDGFAKLDALLKESNFRPDGSFAVVFPRYATDDEDGERTVMHIADLIFNEATRRGWGFERDIPVE